MDMGAFRDEIGTFLDAWVPPRDPTGDGGFTWGEGSDRVAVFEELDDEREREVLDAARWWLETRSDAGLGWITGPAAYGGRGLTPAHEATYRRLEARHVTPDMGLFDISLGMIAPTILAHGQDAVKERYLARMWRGELIACQLFSEPGAGSDLAGVQMRARRDGDEWVLDGQKVWTSGAHFSDLGEALCRTDPDAPKHRGLTTFLVDMHAPGVEVRRLRQMTGGATFNEVFLSGVRVPDDHRLGAVDDGWRVALTTLMNERASIGSGSGGGGAGVSSLARLKAMVDHLDRADDPVLRDHLVQVWMGFQVAKWTGRRARDRMRAGGEPGPEMSLGKLALTQNLTALGQLVSEVLGPRLTADTGEWGTYAWNDFVLGTPGMRLAGGTDEVMRTIIGERVLGLPKEPPPPPSSAS